MAAKKDFLPKEGELIIGQKHNYKIVQTIGKGGFGAVFLAHRQSDNIEVAIKVETVDCKKQLHRMEQKVLANALASKSPFFVAVFDRGTAEGRFFFLAMQLIHRNMWDLRGDRPHHKFSLNTALRSAEQCLAGIRDLHKMGFLHRDIKPPNFAAGRAKDGAANTVFILDFGLCRKYLDEAGQIKPMRDMAPFRGTVRYASNNVHKNIEQSRRDDVESWMYMVLEWTTGSLPWRNVNPKDREAVLKMKKDFRKDDVLDKELQGAPIREYRRILRYVDELTYEHVPDYDGIYRILRKIAIANNIPDDAPLDWTPDQPYDGPPFFSGRVITDPSTSMTGGTHIGSSGSINMKIPSTVNGPTIGNK